LIGLIKTKKAESNSVVGLERFFVRRFFTQSNPDLMGFLDTCIITFLVVDLKSVESFDMSETFQLIPIGPNPKLFVEESEGQADQ
jgi:hypothetical protein